MEPTFKAGKIVIASSLWAPREHNVVVLRHGGLEKIKRIRQLKDGKIFVVGDNVAVSTDSRSFGWLPATDIVATVVWPRH
jgi:type IV secretory pathway protease TraF